MERLDVRLDVGDRLRPGVHVTVWVTLVLGLRDVDIVEVGVVDLVVLGLCRGVRVSVRVIVLEGVIEGLDVSEGL